MKKILSTCFVSLAMLGTPTLMLSQFSYAVETPVGEITTLAVEVQTTIDALCARTIKREVEAQTICDGATEAELREAIQATISQSGASDADIVAALTVAVQVYQRAGNEAAVDALTNAIANRPEEDNSGATDGSGNGNNGNGNGNNGNNNGNNGNGFGGGNNGNGRGNSGITPPPGGGGGGSDY